MARASDESIFEYALERDNVIVFADTDFAAMLARSDSAKLGAQDELISLADQAVCESISTGFECRDDVTGAPTRAAYSSGYPAGSAYVLDELERVTGDTVAVVTARPGAHDLAVTVMPVRGNGVVATFAVDIPAATSNGSSSVCSAVALGSSSLAHGATLVLLRRIDLASQPLPAVTVRPGTTSRHSTRPRRVESVSFRPRCWASSGVVAFERITVDPNKMGGLACIRDLRMTVSAVLGQLAAGRTVEQVLEDYPYLERDDTRLRRVIGRLPNQGGARV
jgi:uncharacterized protein (DUF433 family)